MLVLAIAVLLMLYFLSTSAIFKPSRIPRQARPENRPWLEEERILAAGEIIDLPDPPKPELNENITITASVLLNGQERGQLDLDFDTQGRVNGFWECSFLQDDKRRNFEAESQGNIDVTKTYIDKEKEDTSLLYFITKGTFTETVDNIKTGQTTSNGGIIYMTGYLNPEYDAFGQITITTDKSWSVNYEFDSKLEISASFADDE
jgi:hypothetical protein